MKVHELKTIRPYFNDVMNGLKKFEVRKNDRDFKPYDMLLLKEWVDNKYTGSWILVMVEYFLSGQDFIKEDHVVMGIRIIEKHNNDTLPF